MAATRLKGRRKKAAATSRTARTASSASTKKKATPRPPAPNDTSSASFKPVGMSSEAFLKVGGWSPTVLPNAVEIAVNDRVDVVLTMVGHLSGKYGKGNIAYKKMISDEAHRIVTGRQLSEDLDPGDCNELDSLINLNAQAIVMQVRDLGGKFLKLAVPNGKKRSSTKGCEIGDIAAIKKTKTQLDLAMKKLPRDSGKGAERGKSQSSAVKKQSPSAEEKKYLARLSSPGKAQVGCLISLPSWDVHSAVKIINIPAFYAKDELTAGDSADAENATTVAAARIAKPNKNKNRLSWKTGSDVGPEETPSASTKNRATEEPTAKLNFEEPAHEQCATESLKPLDGATPSGQQLELNTPPFFSPRPMRASCPSTTFQAVRTPTLQDLLELKDDLFARDTAKPGMMGQPKTTGELADGELKHPSNAGSTKRSSCPPVFMSPIAVSCTPKKRVKMAHIFSSPAPADEMARPPTIFRTSTVNLSDVVKGISLEGGIAKRGALFHPGMSFSSLKTPTRIQAGIGQGDSAVVKKGALLHQGMPFSSLKTPTRIQAGMGQGDPSVAAVPSFNDWDDWGSADENYMPTQLRQQDSCKSVGSTKPTVSADSRGATLEDLRDISCLFGVESFEQV
jgi:hypothetical protein